MTELIADLHINPLEPTPTLDSWAPINLNTLPDKPPVQPDLGNTSLVYPGKRHVFSGAPESAKTLAAYCILIQIARQGGLGILIDFEMGGYDARKRLHELGATNTEIDRIPFIEPDERATANKISRLINLDPHLVVIDASAGVYSLEGLDDNKRLDVEKHSALYIKAFWRNQIATILIDHVVKDTETRGRYAIGSERKLGGADVHLGFDTIQPISRGTQGKYKITTHKDRGGFLKRGHLADLALDSDPDTHNIAWAFMQPVVSVDEQGHFRPTIKMEEVSNALRDETEPLSKAEVKRRVGGNAEMGGKAIEALIREGHLTSSSGPRGAILVTLTRPYNRADDPQENGTQDPTCSPVPDLFSSCSGTGDRLTCSAVPLPTGGNSSGTAVNATSNGQNEPHLFSGWLDEDGNLEDTPFDAAYMQTLTPDDDDG